MIKISFEMGHTYIVLLLISAFIRQATPSPEQLKGAWELVNESDSLSCTWIFTENHFSIACYRQDPAKFIYTKGGKWSVDDEGRMVIDWEFNTENGELVGEQQRQYVGLADSLLVVGDSRWKQVDNGLPGALAGAWLITGRMRHGEISPMSPGARKTLKILSGTRFQWIAYNSETGDFFGTGGGSYSTDDSRYTEHIRFFSRDNARVGARLAFDYALKEGKWHHSGTSSKGEPLYEVWSSRSSLGL